MHTPFDPDDMVTLAEAIARAEAELEESNFRELIDRTLRRAREIVDRMSAEGHSLADIAQAISAQPDGPPVAWVIDEAEREVSEVKGMLTAGQDRATIVEAMMAVYPEFLRGGLVLESVERVVDACARDLAQVS